MRARDISSCGSGPVTVPSASRTHSNRWSVSSRM
jgi:hypothetical protein